MERKTQVLLINPPNPEPAPTYFGPPYGLALIGAQLLKRGISTAALDMDEHVPARTWGVLESRVKKLSPAVIGIACQSSTRGAVYRLLALLRKLAPQAKLVVGGPFVNDFYAPLLRLHGADCAVIGDGEITLPELVEAYAAGRKPWTVPGTAALSAGRMRIAPPRQPLANLDDNPFPAFELFDFKGRLAPARAEAPGPLGFLPDERLLPRCRATALSAALMLLSSRGCLYACNFCPMSGAIPQKLRLHSSEYFAAMVAHFSRRYGVRDFVFGDNFFTADKARTFKICALLEKLNPKVRWMCMTRSDAVTPELLRAMARAGCIEISYGVESCSKTVQRAIGKGLDPACVSPCIENTEKAGIDSVLMLMCGSPGESETTVRETLSAVRLMQPSRAMVKRVLVYPGTKLHGMAAKAGIPPRGYYEGAQHKAPFYTAELPESELARLHRMLCERRVYLTLPVKKSGADERLTEKYCLCACQRGEAVVFGGGALGSPELLGALEACQKCSLHHADFMTDARALLTPGLARRLRGYPLAENMLIPIYALVPQAHDALAGVSGALAHSLAAAMLWRNLGGPARAGVYLSGDLRELADITGRVTEHGFCGLDFVLGAGSDWTAKTGAGRARWTDVKDHVARAAQKASALGLAPGICGVPECMLAGLEGLACENRRPFDERLSPRGPVALSRERELKLKTKLPRCADCCVRGQCEGIWRWYIKAYGDSEISPL